MAEVSEDRFIEVGGRRLRYIEAGAGDPIVFQAGLGFDASADQFVLAMRILGERYRVIAFDRFGWGWSDRPASGYSFEAWTDSTVGFLDALEIDRAHLVGHTLGGWVAALVAHEHPERVGKLILVNTAGLNRNAPTPPQNYKLPDRGAARRSLENTFGPGFDVTDAMVDEQMARIERPGIAEAFTAVLAYVNDPAMRQAFWLPDRLPEVQAPTLVVWGADDHIIGPEHGQQAADLLPNGKLILIDQGEHIPLARKPEEFCRVTAEFLG